MRTRMEDLIQIGVPTNRLGMMLTFSSTPKAGGRESLQPLAKWLDVVKWEALAAKQIAAELDLASVWSWGWAAFNPAGNDPDKPTAACTWLWTRDHSLCDAPALAGKQLDPSLDVGATLPAGTLCLLGMTQAARERRRRADAPDRRPRPRLLGGVPACGARAGSPSIRRTVARAERDTILDHFGGSRAAYMAALARAKATPALARLILADELRRRAVEATLARPSADRRRSSVVRDLRAMLARPCAPPRRCRGSATRSGLAVAGVAPGRLLALAAGER